MARVTADTLIRDVLLTHQGAADVFERHGLPCGTCMAASMDTISAVATMHDVSPDLLLEDLNALPPVPPEEG
jgi:hybrid cluster-associated redox disulfide protein